MTPATTASKAYYNEKQFVTRPVAKVEVEEAKPHFSFVQRLEAGINWFSQNLTGQYKSDETNEY